MASAARDSMETRPLLENAVVTVTEDNGPDDDCSPAALQSKLRKIEKIIAKHVPEAIEREARDSIDVPDDVVSEAYKIGGHAGPFLCLLAMEAFGQKSGRDLHFKELRLSRAAYAESLAIELVHVYTEPQELFTQVLARKFSILVPLSLNSTRSKSSQPVATPPISPLEKGVQLRAMMFISDSFVREALQHIWYGRLYLSDPEATVPSYQPVTETHRERLPQHRMKIPVYTSAAEIGMFIVFLCVYSWVVNHRTIHMTAIEGIMYVLALSYGLHEVRQVWDAGTDYFADFYNWFDSSAVFIFACCFATRMLAMESSTRDDRDSWNDWSFDLLSVNAVFLWGRTLSIFSLYEFFGIAMLVTRRMFQDAALFVLLMGVVLIGFSQAFYGLRPDIPLQTSFYLLLKSILGGTDFDSAEEYSPQLGGALMSAYMFAAGLILLNVLIAIFNSSYTTIIDAAGVEFQYAFAQKVCLDFWARPDDFAFLPPANLIDVTLVQPLKLLRVPGAKKFESWAWNLLVLPQTIIIFIYEKLWQGGPPGPWKHEVVLKITPKSSAKSQGDGDEEDDDLRLAEEDDQDADDLLESTRLGLNTGITLETQAGSGGGGSGISQERIEKLEKQLERMEALLRALAGGAALATGSPASSSASLVPSGV